MELNKEQKNKLLKIASETIRSCVSGNNLPEFKIVDPHLLKKQGAFVTIHKNGQLRGCIGQILPDKKPLWQVVQDMAIEASANDPRFPAVEKRELDEFDIEVSVLSEPELINDWQKIKLGKHGVIVKKGFNSGVFLP